MCLKLHQPRRTGVLVLRSDSPPARAGGCTLSTGVDSGAPSRIMARARATTFLAAFRFLSSLRPLGRHNVRFDFHSPMEGAGLPAHRP